MKKLTRRDFIRNGGKFALGISIAAGFSSLMTGCEGMGDVAALGSSIASSTGLITQSQANSITRSAKAVARTFEDITPEQEYYIGRSVAAMILARYRPYKKKTPNRYVNLVGQTLAMASDRPETFGGYHFLILDSGDINALSAPGGLIFITRGLLRCCRHEDALASVLAHEIGHVQYQHGLQAINKSRITEAVTVLGTETAKTKTFAGEDLASLTSIFEDSVSDILKTMIDSGYSRKFEFQADDAAITIMERVGYNPSGLIDMLNMMKMRLRPGRGDFAKTHPSPSQRIENARDLIGPYVPVEIVKARQSRFLRALKHI